MPSLTHLWMYGLKASLLLKKKNKLCYYSISNQLLMNTDVFKNKN